MGRKIYSILFIFLMVGFSALSQERGKEDLQKGIDKEVKELMDMGNIPGLSLVVIKNGREVIKSYGYADIKRKIPVTPATLFEIGSCSKAFTALAAAQLIYDKRLRLDDYVSAYIPWFHTNYKDSAVQITIRQLLHHTSGIPWSTISKIPQSNSADALEKTVRQLVGLDLKRLPGKKYEYATINYDVLALIIQNITHQSFESYIRDSVIRKLRLNYTDIGTTTDSAGKATGYKIGFFKAREYKSPDFRGNNAAGYVISNALDMARWLRFQMGDADTALYHLAEFTHQRDETVPIHDMDSYAMGWQVSLSGNGEIYHDGLNPNYTAYVAFRKKDTTGVVVLANSNSTYSTVIGNKIMKMLEGGENEREYDPGDGNDKDFSIGSIILGGYIITFLAFIFWTVSDIIRRKRKYAGYSRAKLTRIGLLFVASIPFLAGLYILPEAIYGFSWKAMIVWTPVSFGVMLRLLIVSLIITYCAYILSLGFPDKNKFRRIIPKLLLLSILSGLANMSLIILITSSLNSDVDLKYLIFFYLLSLSAYLSGKRFVEVGLITFTMEVIYELRLKLADRIFSTSYRKFEEIDRGFIYTAMNDDVSTIGESTNTFVALATSFFTAVGALMYLASVAFWASLLTFGLILTLSALYYFVSRNTRKYYDQARDARDVFMRLLNGMIDGFKEISISSNKKREYKEDVGESAGEYKQKMVVANTRFVNASVIGEAVLVAILGTVAFAFPKLFPSIKVYTLMSFVIVLLYLIGPVNAILNSVPQLMRLRIATNRIKEFLNSIPEQKNKEMPVPTLSFQRIDSIRAEGVKFEYTSVEGEPAFTVGPIDLEVKRGEIVFIVGGNGSGKTTLAKLFTGLYTPDQGRFMINGQAVESCKLGEYFATVFSPMYIFQKLYNVQLKDKSEEVAKYLKLLDLDKKLTIKNNRFSTIDLSTGQKKRMALLQCYLEGSPIYLFDEWAADQDPAYRQFFYRSLLPAMKMAGKIIIAITHDEHYFDVADRVYIMDQGKLDAYSFQHLWAAAPFVQD